MVNPGVESCKSIFFGVDRLEGVYLTESHWEQAEGCKGLPELPKLVSAEIERPNFTAALSAEVVSDIRPVYSVSLCPVCTPPHPLLN